MQLQHQLPIGRRSSDVDITLLTHADLVTETVDDVAFAMRIQRQVVQPAVREPVAIVFCILDLGYQAYFRKVGYAFVYAGARSQAGDLLNQRCWDQFMVLASLLDGLKNAPVIRSKIADCASVEFHRCDIDGRRGW